MTVPIQLERSLKTEQSRIIPEETTMRFNFKKLALLGAWIIFAEGSVYPQDVIDKLQPLVEMSVRRLAIA